MKLSIFILAVAGLSLLGTVSLRAGGAPDIEASQSLAEVLCARCHATGVIGKSPLDPAPPFRTLSSRWPLDNLEEALAEGIVVGHKGMPAFVLTPEQISDFIGYLRTLN